MGFQPSEKYDVYVCDPLETEVAGFLWGNDGGWRQGESSQTDSGAE